MESPIRDKFWLMAHQRRRRGPDDLPGVLHPRRGDGRVSSRALDYVHRAPGTGCDFDENGDVNAPTLQSEGGFGTLAGESTQADATAMARRRGDFLIGSGNWQRGKVWRQARHDDRRR